MRLLGDLGISRAMKHLLVALFVLAACKASANEKSAPPPAPPAKKTAEPAPAPAPAAAPTPAPADQADTAPRPFDNGDPMPFDPYEVSRSGKQPYLSDAGKRGIVELVAVDDASGRTKGTFKVTRRCGAAAVTAVDAIVAQMDKREKAGSHDRTNCIGDKITMLCLQGGNGEGDNAYELVYKADARGVWALVGVKTYAMGVTMDKQEAELDKLAATSCPSAGGPKRI
jgi:hypothetical protein